jgi:GH15 family glucan-1,4-alpha-glucosidase
MHELSGPEQNVWLTGAQRSIQPAIGDYAVIGDCRSAALVSRAGSIDWLCFPRFDSPSMFAALLDPARGGHFSIHPTQDFQTQRRYLPETNILETTFSGPTGAFVLRDFMPVASEEAKRRQLLPDRQLLRDIEGLRGDVEIEVVYEPRPNYGRSYPVLTDHGPFGIWCDEGRSLVILRSEIPLRVLGDRRSARGCVRIRAGQHASFSLTYEEDGPATLPPLGASAKMQLRQSAAWWQAWAARCRYQGPYRDAVIRSALTLKLLTYAPSGAIVAAPTTSLPEKLGGSRNWDYRYCWLRDASFTIRALLALGYDAEAEAFLGWMLHATRLTWPELQIVYTVYGETKLTEHELGHLSGYAESRPVRIGNDAHGQLQLDVYGEVLDAAAQFAAHGRRFDRDAANFLTRLGTTVCRSWREPDEGIWEGRSGRFQHTHSKVLCWVALDRLLAMHEAGQLTVDVSKLRRERDALRAVIEQHGYNRDLDSYTRTLDGTELDASLLVLPLYGYLDASDPRMRSTLGRILENLSENGLVYRYGPSTADGLPPGEGAFGICSFAAVECLARAGDIPGAIAAFEHLLGYQNDVGLFAEEIDPETGAALGNFPQAFTHIGLINAALTLSACQGTPARRPIGEHAVFTGGLA